MKALIVYAHPYEKSYNHAVLKAVESKIKDRDYTIIDLYKDEFNPSYTKEELALFSKGETLDPLVRNYQTLLKESDTLIFIFPIWWNDVPAIIKGFMDKVMKKQFAYEVGKTGVKGKLSHINHVYIYTTSTSPTWYLKLVCGNAIKSVFINATLKQLGMKNCKWKNFGNIDNSSLNQREEYLENITKGEL